VGSSVKTRSKADMGARKMIASTASFVNMERKGHVHHLSVNTLTIIEERNPCRYTIPPRGKKRKM